MQTTDQMLNGLRSVNKIIGSDFTNSLLSRQVIQPIWLDPNDLSILSKTIWSSPYVSMEKSVVLISSVCLQTGVKFKSHDHIEVQLYYIVALLRPWLCWTL